MQAIPVTRFNRDLCIKSYALPNNGSDKTQRKRKFTDALQFQQPKDTNPLASLHDEHSVKTADVMIGIGALYSSCPVIRILVYATATEAFPILTVKIEVMNKICRDHPRHRNKSFPTIRDNRIGILIGTDAFTATVPKQFTTGPTGNPYGVKTPLGWTLGAFLRGTHRRGSYNQTTQA